MLLEHRRCCLLDQELDCDAAGAEGKDRSYSCHWIEKVKILLKLVWILVEQSAGAVFVAGWRRVVDVEDGDTVVHIFSRLD
ncbi:hypothetical protein OIU74_023688 [Salix koriyanagi]|uniref:Uncharacterized protein n=1 Tax=Salix koriyanagi TaxID=2511006 RepID=A0A9Q0WFV1_9ROSI|nr:hypothetical protein OIU74_023688 [Salix koriyanagi]